MLRGSRERKWLALPLFATALCGAFAQAPAAGEWQPLFDGKSLEGWREAPYDGRGQLRVQNGAIVLGKGVTTGIVWTSPVTA